MQERENNTVRTARVNLIIRKLIRMLNKIGHRTRGYIVLPFYLTMLSQVHRLHTVEQEILIALIMEAASTSEILVNV